MFEYEPCKFEVKNKRAKLNGPFNCWLEGFGFKKPQSKANNLGCGVSLGIAPEKKHP